MEITVDVDNPDGTAKDLTGASVEFALSERPDGPEELSQDDSGVTAAVTDAAAGEVTITIDADTTDGMARKWYYEVRVTDSEGKKSVVTRGTLRISERLNA